MYRVSIFTIMLLLSTSIQADRRVTVVRMMTERTTLTTTVSANTFCFSLSTREGMPITPCRRRRQHWIEEPIFFAPEGQIKEEQSQFIIDPRQIVQVEPTALPVAGSSKYGYAGLKPDVYESPDAMIKQSIEPSVFVPVNSEHLRLYFSSSDFLRRMLDYLTSEWYRRDNTERTVTFTRTKTVTARDLSIKTNTVGISGCTPSPLPHAVCT